MHCTSSLRHVLPARCQRAAGRPDEHSGETKAQRPALLVSAIIAPTVPAPHPVIITRHCVIYPRAHSIKLENGQCKARILAIAQIVTWWTLSFQCIDLLIQLFKDIIMSSADLYVSVCGWVFQSENKLTRCCVSCTDSWSRSVCNLSMDTLTRFSTALSLVCQ